MFIQTEDTPNPASLKFIPGKPVKADGPAEFGSADEAAVSPLASALFEIDGVRRVFFGSDFLTVTKTAEREWSLMKPALLGAIMEHFLSGRPLIRADAAPRAVDVSEADAEIVDQIIEILDTRVRPAVANDGGDIVFDGFQDGIVFLSMRGACAGCPSSTATLKSGIENLMRHYVPEVTEVREAGGPDDFRY